MNSWLQLSLRLSCMREVPVPPAPSILRAQFAMASAALRLQIPIVHWASGSFSPSANAPPGHHSPLPSVPRAQFEMVSASLRLHTPISHWASASLHRPQGALSSAPTGGMRLHSESQDEIRRRIPKLFSSFRAHAVRVKNRQSRFCHHQRQSR